MQHRRAESLFLLDFAVANTITEYFCITVVHLSFDFCIHYSTANKIKPIAKETAKRSYCFGASQCPFVHLVLDTIFFFLLGTPSLVTFIHRGVSSYLGKTHIVLLGSMHEIITSGISEFSG